MTRLAIVGSRGFRNLELVRRFVRSLKPTTVVVSGGAVGVDSEAESAARQCGLKTEVFPAHWSKYGKSAGPIRNRQIVHAVEGLVAFWDSKSRGTAHVIQLARRKGIWLRVFDEAGMEMKQSFSQK